MPGTDNSFELKAYKEALGKPYSRITFFLETQTDYFDYIFSSNVPSSSDESVTEVTTTGSNSSPTTCTTSTSSTSTCTSDTSSFITNTTACATTTGTPFYTQQQPSTSGINEKQPSLSGTVQCPICLQLFCFEEIEAHASNCSGWLLESDQPQDLKDDDEDDYDGNVKIMVTDGFVDRKKLLQEEVNQLVAGTDEMEQTRVTVRRKCLWEDFKSARLKKLKPTSNLKVVFLGEPCVDDGGPKRELFTGKFHWRIIQLQ